MVIVSPLNGVIPLTNGLFLAYKLGLLTTYYQVIQAVTFWSPSWRSRFTFERVTFSASQKGHDRRIARWILRRFWGDREEVSIRRDRNMRNFGSLAHFCRDTYISLLPWGENAALCPQLVDVKIRKGSHIFVYILGTFFLRLRRMYQHFRLMFSGTFFLRGCTAACFASTLPLHSMEVRWLIYGVCFFCFGG